MVLLRRRIGLCEMMRRRGAVVLRLRSVCARRSPVLLVGILLVVVRRRVAVHWQRGLRRRRRRESVVEVVQDGEVGFDVGWSETPG